MASTEISAKDAPVHEASVHEPSSHTPLPDIPSDGAVVVSDRNQRNGVEPSDRQAQRDLARRVAIELGVAYALLTLAWILIGRAILDIAAIVDTDESVSADLAANRTASMDDLSTWGSMLSDTMVKIVATALVAAAVFAVWRKWRDVGVLVLSLVLEASVFITVTWVIARARPDVLRLEDSPVDSSFPSGHVAAAAAYGALVVVVAWHTRRWWPRAATALAVAMVVATVAWSRVYRGMHYVSDVVAGAALGVASVAAVWWIMRRHDPDHDPDRAVSR